MATITTSDIADLANTTLASYDFGKWTDISLDLQNYTMLKRIMANSDERSGEFMRDNIQTSNMGHARMTGLYEVDTYNNTDITNKTTVPFRFFNTYALWDVNEVAMNAGDRVQLINLMKLRIHSSRNDAHVLAESQGWSKPADSTDVTSLWGIPYWVVKNASGSGEGSGGNPTGFSSGAGSISSSTVTKWANWADGYSTISQSDFVRSCRRAVRQCEFTDPDPYAAAGSGQKWGLYTNIDVLQELEEYGENRTDNLGGDIAVMEGKMTFRRVPVTWVPYLDDDTRDPMYGINWNFFGWSSLKGRNMVQSPQENPSNMHNCVAINTDNGGNFRCWNRRAQFVLSK